MRVHDADPAADLGAFQATAGRMHTHGVTPARSASTHPSRTAAAPTRRPDRGYGR